jgi:hypothetical protein
MSHDQSQEIEGKIANRRNFLKTAGVTGLGLASATLAAGKLGVLENTTIGKSLGLNPTKVEAASFSDVDILNFALNLEYLEAEFYTKAVYGITISQGGIGTSGVGNEGPTTGGKKVAIPDTGWGATKLKSVAEELALDEQTHVQLLRSALGSSAVAKPAINLDALGIGFATFQQFLILARAFEDTGVSAYGGAAPLITSKDILATAAKIALTEALHSGFIRSLIGGYQISVPALDAKDRVPPPAGTRYFTVDQNALAIVRTPSQVLAIAYGSSAPGTSSGGFFPNGFNGAITMV